MRVAEVVGEHGGEARAVGGEHGGHALIIGGPDGGEGRRIGGVQGAGEREEREEPEEEMFHGWER